MGDGFSHCGDVGLDGDVERLRFDVLGSQSLGVAVAAYAGDDVKATAGQVAGGGGADPGRGAGPSSAGTQAFSWDRTMSPMVATSCAVRCGCPAGAGYVAGYVRRRFIRNDAPPARQVSGNLKAA